MARSVIDAITATNWAIQEEWLHTIAAIAEREHEYAGNIEALEQKLGRPLNNTHDVTVRDGVAIVPIVGPLFRRADFFSKISGATSYDTIARDIREASDNPYIHSILLNIDSPGGEVNGVSELANQIYSLRGKKKVIAYASGTMASAAYWLGSAADSIVASETAMIGSIGAMVSMRVDSENPKTKSYKFVSSQSPLKNASPETDIGAREIQRVVDELAQVFIDTVARQRGINAQGVLDNYGQGSVFVGGEAKKRSMVDEIGIFETIVNDLIRSGGLATYKE